MEHLRVSRLALAPLTTEEMPSPGSVARLEGLLPGALATKAPRTKEVEVLPLLGLGTVAVTETTPSSKLEVMLTTARTMEAPPLLHGSNKLLRLRGLRVGILDTPAMLVMVQPLAPLEWVHLPVFLLVVLALLHLLVWVELTLSFSNMLGRLLLPRRPPEKLLLRLRVINPHHLLLLVPRCLSFSSLGLTIRYDE